MNTIYAPAFAAFGGSAFGAISTIVTGWVTRRRRLRERHFSRSISKRERLYRSFIEEASRVYADALVSDKSEIPQLVNLYALIGRMRILSSDQVVQAAERAGRLIIETYLSPNREFGDLPEFLEEMDPLRGFGEACLTRIAFDPISLRSQTMQERISQAGSSCIRQRIVQAAIRLHRQIGFKKTTVADIARGASMSPANVYRFFASKQAIEEAIVTDLFEQVSAAATLAALLSGSALDRLTAALSGGFNWSAQHTNLLARWSVDHEATTSHLLLIRSAV